MTRVQKEVMRPSIEPVQICDYCSAEVPSMLPPAGWIVLREVRDAQTSQDPPKPFDQDFCKPACLHAWIDRETRNGGLIVPYSSARHQGSA